MGGGLMQLVAYGAQDVYLTGNPQITFFKVVYRRHTNFAMESIEQTFDSTPDFGKRVSCSIGRSGDLCHKIYLEVTLPKLNHETDTDIADTWLGYVNSVGHALVKSVEVEIGGQRIDKQYADYMEMWDELTCTAEKQDRFREDMIGKYQTELALQTNATVDKTYYIPLQFWFCKNPGLALPLISLQYHEVKITVDFEELNNLVVNGDAGTNDNSETISKAVISTTKSLDASLWCDYIYLDTDERRRFAQASHEYLIEQIQYTGAESSESQSNKIRLNFNHPIKEIMWVIEKDVDTSLNRHFMYSMDGEDNEPVTKAKILLNGHDRITERKGSYFRLVQPYQHHTRIPSKHVYCYSFALKPEDHQPSGTCNFSRIDNATLSLDRFSASAAKIKVFAVNYNVLRIMSGMGGLAFSN